MAENEEDKFFQHQFSPTWSKFLEKCNVVAPKNTDDVTVILSGFDKNLWTQGVNYIKANLLLYANPKKISPKLFEYYDYKSIYVGLGGFCVVLLRIIQIMQQYNDSFSNSKSNANNDNNDNNNNNINDTDEKKQNDLNNENDDAQKDQKQILKNCLLQVSKERTQRWNVFVSELMVIFGLDPNAANHNENSLINALLNVIDKYNLSMYDDFDARSKKHQRYTLLEGIAGADAIRAIMYYFKGNNEKFEDYLQRLKNLYVDVLELNAYEILYGRMGYISAFAMIQHFTNQKVLDCEEVKKVINSVIENGKIGAKSRIFAQQNVPLMWAWHGKNYFGGAHGVSGILNTILLCLPYLNISKTSENTNSNNEENESYEHLNNLDEILKAAVEKCTKFKFKNPSYNFASSPRSLSKNKDDLVQWCHGAPGFISMYCQAFETFSLKEVNNDTNNNSNEHSKKWMELATNATNTAVWERGLLKKGHGLCHGIGGNGYSFLRMYRMYSMYNRELNADKDERLNYLYKAMQFLSFVSHPNTRFPYQNDRPYSLFEGTLGGCVFVIDTLFAPETSSFPCFEYNL